MFEALSCAIEVCMDGGASPDLLADGVAILVARRSERETETRANWRLVGRG